ncbi:MAG: helix-turn-helix transcriptional regulator, partial [Anaerolineae bacterium]|nr:helix-turn-helix transcriptional regulator [Anaerolineae bacterium]
HHAFAAEDFERVADLVERAVPAMRLSRQEATVLAWLRALPDALFRNRPVLSAHYAGALLLNGALEGVEVRLREAERWLNPAETMREPSAPLRMVVIDEAEFRRLPGVIAVYRAAVALARGNVTDTVKYAQRALDLLPEPAHLTRGAAAGFLGLAAWTGGDLETAHRMYAEAMASLQQAGHIADAIGCAIALADIRRGQGRLREAMRTYQQALQLVLPPGAATPAVRGMADMHVGLSELHREHNDLNTAIQHLQKSKEPGEHIGLPQNRYRWRVAMARIRVAQGDPAGALDLLDEAERLYVSDFFPNVHPIAAFKARVWIAQRRLEEALGWVRAQGLSADNDLSYLREFEHITLARVLLARYQHDRADSAMLEVVGLLERLLHAAEAGARTGSVIEILVLQALAQAMQDNIPAALASLQRALTLAEPEGYVRIFVDEGPPVAALLSRLHSSTESTRLKEYSHQLLLALAEEQGSEAAEEKSNDSPRPVGPSAPQPLIEPLSQRELEILRLFNTELSGPEIARELVIALSTVRTHTKSIYSKLNVTSRRAAVKRAEELGLI